MPTPARGWAFAESAGLLTDDAEAGHPALEGRGLQAEAGASEEAAGLRTDEAGGGRRAPGGGGLRAGASGGPAGPAPPPMGADERGADVFDFQRRQGHGRRRQGGATGARHLDDQLLA